MSEKFEGNLSPQEQKKTNEEEILEKAVPIILKKYEEYQWPELKHPDDDGGATAEGYSIAHYDFKNFLKSLEK